MFGWFSKKPKPNEDAAFQKGQQLAGQMTSEVDRFIEQGLGPYREFQLKRLDELVLDGVATDEAPPIIMARRAYASFLDSITQYRDEVRTRADDFLKEWFEISDMLQMRDKLVELIAKRLSDFHVDLRLAGMKVLIDRADMLKEFDDQWRAENPEKATQFPPD